MKIEKILIFFKKSLDKPGKVWYIIITKGKEIKKMYEFEIRYLATGETDFLYGYSLRDLTRRYPNIPTDTYVVIGREYID